MYQFVTEGLLKVRVILFKLDKSDIVYVMAKLNHRQVKRPRLT
jgi:hypothetical protein